MKVAKLALSAKNRRGLGGPMLGALDTAIHGGFLMRYMGWRFNTSSQVSQ